MRIRQILLIHPKRSIRALIKKFVFAELSDTEILETENCETALAELNKRPFDVVIANGQLVDMTAGDLKISLAQTNHNSKTPFIILIEDENDADEDVLIQKGFEHIVHIRVRPADLIEKINHLCNPRAWRRDTRYHLPDANVTIDIWGTKTEATLINISKGGVMVELNTFQPDLLMKNDISITLRAPTPSGLATISDLTCKLSRLNVTAWHPNNSPAAMRATFIFVDPGEGALNELEEILRTAREDELGTEDDKD